MNEDQAATSWIRRAVLAETTLDPWDHTHDGWNQGYTEVIVYSFNRGGDTKYSNGRRAWFTKYWQVMAIVQGNRPDDADRLAGLIDRALHRKINIPLDDGWFLYQSLFNFPLRYPTTGEDGTVYRHAGAVYELKLNKRS